MDRRQFVTKILQLPMYSAIGSMLPLHSFAAKNAEPHHLLVLRINGAWDVLMAMDAKSNESVRELGFKDSQFFSFEARNPIKNMQNSLFGSAFNPLVPYMSDLAVVNGIMMLHNNSAHEANRRYMASGLPTTPFGAFQIGLADKTGASRVGYDIEYESLEDGGFNQKYRVDGLKVQKSTENDYEALMEEMLQAGSDSGLYEALLKDKENLESLKTLEKLTGSYAEKLTGVGRVSDSTVGAMAGISSGFLKTVQVDFVADASLDTHSSHPERHTPNLTKVFEQVASLIKFMKATPYEGAGVKNKSIFDMTTVLVMSEFARTSAAEGSTGTGHNQYCNSCLLFGKNVKSGQVVGESNLYMKDGSSHLIASLWDYKKGQPLSRKENLDCTAKTIGYLNPNNLKVDYIYPETIWRTIAKIMNVDLPDLENGSVLQKLIKV